MAKDTLVLPTTKQPTFWNRDAAFGFFGTTLLFTPLVGVAGLIVGGLMGKERMQKELTEGRKVNPPTIWNKTMVIGAGIAAYASVAIALAIMVPAIAFGSPFIATTAIVSGLVGMAASPFVGAYIGGMKGKQRLTNDYAEAKAFEAYTATQSRYMGQSPSASRSQAFGVTADEVAQMESRFANADKASFVDKLGNQAEIAQTNAR